MNYSRMKRRKLTRRTLLRSVALSPFIGQHNRVTGGKRSGPKPGDVRVEDIAYSYEEFLYRTPYQFGGRVVDRVTLLNVNCRLRSIDGRSAQGFASMPLGNAWAFPSKVMSYDVTLTAMKTLADRISKITGAYKESGHPIDINWALEPEYLKAATEVSKQLSLAAAIPKLCTLVTASPFDAAIHDAYGKLHGRNCYSTYGPDLMTHDLSRYLGPEFKGEYLNRYVKTKPAPRTPLFHSVGAGDPIVESDIRKKIGDGLPETLAEWIHYNGLIRIKIKLNGEDLRGDVERTVAINRVAEETQQKRGVKEWFYCADFNENCPNVGFVIDYLSQLKEKMPAGFYRIQYVEQPTARDLRAHRSNVMHEASKLRPVVIDESLTDLETLLLAREMGYTGVALKACKGQSQAMLMAAAAQKYKMFLCVQDLTCPGASFIHNAGIAAHVPGTSGIEGNSRQYVPAANKSWESKFPGMFKIKNGTLETALLTKPGLSAV